MPRPVSAVGLLLTALLAACSAAEAPDAWERFDLWLTSPRVELPPAAGRSRLPYVPSIAPLGALEVRDLPRVPAGRLAAFPHQSAGQARVLEQVTGSRLAWRLTLGREPYLSFTPLLDAAAPCACTFRVGVRDATEVREVYQTSVGPPPPAPAVARIDLSPWAGREVEILFHLEGPAGGWARWASPAVYSRAARPAPEPDAPPNLLLIGVDTLRADHVGAYRPAGAPPWAPPSLTPAIDALAAESDLWLDAYSTFNATNPSFASILTGLYGKNHGVYDLRTPLPAAHTTLAEVFNDAGYNTLAVISARHLGDHNSGLAQGFDAVVQASEHAAAELAVEATMDWLAERRAPFFVWLHLFDPHTPHTPPQPYALGFLPLAPAGLGAAAGWEPFRTPGPVAYDEPVIAGHRDLYAGEVAYLDHQVDRLLDFLDSRGLLETTIVALVADHGENLGEHGILHRHIGLWETTTRVPMMIRWPGGRGPGRRLPGLVQTHDLFPTLLAGAGLTAPPSDGTPLDRLSGADRPGRRAVFSEHANRLGVRVRGATHSLMRSAGNPHLSDGPHLFALTDDPAEAHNLAGTGLPIEARLAQALDRWLAELRPAPDTGTRDLSEAEIERLRALGYL